MSQFTLVLPPPIREAHVVIGGFTQHADRAHGCWRLRRLLSPKRSPTCAVDLLPWNHDWSRYANQLWLDSDGDDPRICVYAYSWGAGWGFVRFARELARRGLSIDAAVLVDPVYRHCYRCGNWRALVTWPKWLAPVIGIRENVHEVRSFYQTSNWPRSHRLKALSTATHIHEPIHVSRDHEWMDDLEEWHSLSLAVANRRAA